MKMKLRHTIIPMIAACLLLSANALADPVVGQVDTFENGTLLNWHIGEGAPPEAQPVVINAGGPAGAGDHYMQLTSLGMGGPGSKLTIFNNTQWAGDYIAAGVNAVTMDLKNLGATDLYLRLLVAGPFEMGPPANVAFSTDAVFLPAGSDWTSVTFLIGRNFLTAGPGTASGALMNAQELRLFHNPDAAFPGPPVGPPSIDAQLGVDNIRAAAVPEPATMILLGTGLAGIAGALRKRRQAKGE